MTSYMPSLNVQPANQILHIEFADKKKPKFQCLQEKTKVFNKHWNFCFLDKEIHE